MKTSDAYRAAFEKECAQEYPMVDEYERVHGYAIDTVKMREAARVLACPVKVNPPNWQHGRVLYATARDVLARDEAPGAFVDIGTAKGYSAVVLGWAIQDAGTAHSVLSVDVIKPDARVARNSVAEADGSLLTVEEFVAPFIGTTPTEFFSGGSLALLTDLYDAHARVRLAFVDGKHNEQAVRQEIGLLRHLQDRGDVIVFDDLQVPGVEQAVRHLYGYRVQQLAILPKRRYAVAVRT